jgi:hypothetical protein
MMVILFLFDAFDGNGLYSLCPQAVWLSIMIDTHVLQYECCWLWQDVKQRSPESSIELHLSYNTTNKLHMVVQPTS